MQNLENGSNKGRVGGGLQLESALICYAQTRQLSGRQSQVLRLHIGGRHDKEIADVLGTSPATVYEHWRRMARKLARRTKADVVADFHRFLGESVQWTLEPSRCD